MDALLKVVHLEKLKQYLKYGLKNSIGYLSRTFSRQTMDSLTKPLDLKLGGLVSLTSPGSPPVGSSVTLRLVCSSPGGSRRTRSGLTGSLVLESGGHNLWGQVEVVTEVLNPFVGEIPVEMSPGELFLDIPS